MGQFTKRFDYRNHVQGQLVTAAELLEMQKLQYQTYCDIEADKFGLNPDGSFTPHVISGLTPRIDSTARNIIIGRGHGWVTKSGTDLERQPIIVNDAEITVPIPEGSAANPRWLHVLLYNPTANFDEAYGNATVATKDVNNILRNISAPIYVHSVTSAYYTILGDPLATPECPIVTNLNMLPIATIYIPANDTGVIDAANLYDVRWFAPGSGTIGYTKIHGETAFTKTRTWETVREITAPSETVGGFPSGVVGVPNNQIFSLCKSVYPILTAMGTDVTGSTTRVMSARILVTTDALTSPIKTFTYAMFAYNTDGSGADTDVDCARQIGISFNPVI